MRTLHKNRFHEELQPEWVPQGEIQADALKDLQTSENVLSVWQIDDDRTNLDRVLAAVAATRDMLGNIDYALLDIEIFDDLGITVAESPGTVPDETASRAHRDLIQLTAGKAVELAVAISKCAVLERCSKGQIRKALIHSIEAGNIDPSQLRESLARKLL